MSPHAPLTHRDIIDDSARGLDFGIQIVHPSARGGNDNVSTQAGSSDPARLADSETG